MGVRKLINNGATFCYTRIVSLHGVLVRGELHVEGGQFDRARRNKEGMWSKFAFQAY